LICKEGSELLNKKIQKYENNVKKSIKE